ncbi:helicase HerA domain-containing protein [Roseateles terrae]|uniref:Helicase HerA central domain-containing protein n=1 Tax=Roseateles terrae TaxID=431060 RepID=A0ABR6GLI8_9BURK|nr:DUF87 domain-containing protein [Roseateles terrae]MBB3192966.1 hypothetical protein [Roseateles terrae]OWQ89785.1 hypothetical protein CDN98_04540 [Roseateles terrae]
MLVHPEDMLPSQWLGPVVTLCHDQVLMMADRAHWDDQAALCRGAFCFMVETSTRQTALRLDQPPSHHEVRTDRLLLLRLLDFPPWPDASSGVRERIDTLMQRHSGSHAPHSELMLVRFFVLGAFYRDTPPALSHTPRFAGEPGHLLHADRYGVFAPTPRMQDLLINGTVTADQRIRFGLLRHDESQVYQQHPVTSCLSMLDIRGRRTAMFGKTRLGKSNVVKLLVQGMMDVTAERRDVGQLIFDVNGEYANSNPQDGADNIGSVYADRCNLYYLSEGKIGGPNSQLLRFNFHERPEDAMTTLRELLPADVAESDYVRPLLSCRLPGLRFNPDESADVVQRRLRKLMIFWTVLHHAGFEHDEARLTETLQAHGYIQPFNPGFNQPLRLSAYQAVNGSSPPPQPRTFADMVAEISLMLRFSLSYPNDPTLRKQGSFLFDADEEIMAHFIYPQAGAGAYVLRPATPFHSPRVDNFITEILATVDQGGTVIVDLGSANERIIRYFAKTLSSAVFLHQEGKFVRNEMAGRYVQIYFEEAHMIFPPNAGNVIDVYSRFAKEGAKFNIGIVYSTQSPSTINQDLLAQTENFFIGHLSSQNETTILSTVQYAFRGMEEDLMRSRTPGFMRALTASHRYPVPVQANRYDGKTLLMR